MATKKSADARLEKLLYRRQEAAFVLGMSLRAIDYLIADRRITTRRFGRVVLIPAADVRRIAQQIIASDMLDGTGKKGKA